jgi:hypothetical protein
MGEFNFHSSGKRHSVQAARSPFDLERLSQGTRAFRRFLLGAGELHQPDLPQCGARFPVGSAR